MTRRHRDICLLIAGLPGVIALFLPVTELLGHLVPAEYLWRGLAFLDAKAVLSPFFWDVLPVALPIPVATLQLYRITRAIPSSRTMIIPLMVVVFFAATHLVWMVGVTASLVSGLDRLSLEAAALLCLAAVNVWLLYRNLRRNRPLAVTVEVLMLGTYVVVIALWLTIFLSASERLLAPRLMAWTSIVYVVTIIVRLLDGTARSDDPDARAGP